jgi:hypothetical protein
MFASNPGCFAFQADRPADCLGLDEDTSEQLILTTAGRHPPLYYGIVGMPSWISISGKGILAMRVWSAVLAAAFVASAMVSAKRSRFARWMPTAIGLACVPMCFYMFGLVNPSGLEISAAIAAWVSGLVLITSANVDRRVLVRFVVAACALLLTRQLGPLWLGLLVGTLFVVAGRRVCVTLLRKREIQIGVGAVVAAGFAQLAWLVIVKPLDSTRNGTEPLTLTTAQILRGEVGQMWSLTQEAIGVFGWADTLAPMWVYLGTLLVLGGFVLLSIVTCRTRIAALVVAMIAVAYAIPFVLEGPSVRTADYFWQGRYSLPFIVGIPIIAAFALSRERDRPFEITKFGAVLSGVVLVSIEVVAFWQALRRYSVGSGGSLWFFGGAQWTPPLPALLLIVVNAAVMAWWVLQIRPIEPSMTESKRGHSVDSDHFA